jgi:hypothetical protein
MNLGTTLHNEGCSRQGEFRTWVGEQGDHLQRCLECRRVSKAPKAEEQEVKDTTPQPASRYSLACVRCGTTMQVHSPRARIPLCDQCKAAGSARRPPRRFRGVWDGGAL